MWNILQREHFSFCGCGDVRRHKKMHFLKTGQKRSFDNMKFCAFTKTILFSFATKRESVGIWFLGLKAGWLANYERTQSDDSHMRQGIFFFRHHNTVWGKMTCASERTLGVTAVGAWNPNLESIIRNIFPPRPSSSKFKLSTSAASVSPKSYL